VTTTVASPPEGAALPEIQDDWARHKRLPQQHWVGAGYLSAPNLERSERQPQIELCGPPLEDTAWQARAGGGFAASDFQIDWHQPAATCPSGHRSQSWRETTNSRGLPEIKIQFSRTDCRSCFVREQCTRTAEQRRSLTIQPEAECKALAAARARTEQPKYQELYALRSGCQGSWSQAVRPCGLRRARYLGLSQTH
jgi:transposase